jgi:NAD(P)-dependent dehydrogenase (short-subunit alcohol dehydrogenase family)
MAARNISAHAGNVFFISLDLSSLQSVVRFVQQYNAKFPPVDILINNAGLNTNGKTMDGINVLFQVNYLSHYLLTRLFIKSRPPQHSKELRVINLSSLMHHTGTDQFIKSAYSNYPIASPYYSDSKLYMTLLSLELNKRYSLLNTALKQRKNVLALSVNPGGVRSDIWRSIPKIFAGLFDIVMRLLFLTCEQGCVTSVYGAVADVNEVKDYLSQATPSCNKGGNWIIHPFLPYLVPYYIPYDWLFFETLGPFGGPRFGKVSLPKDVMKVSEELWQFSEEICLEKLTKYGVKIDLE